MIESLCLSSLIGNHDYFVKVLPHIKPEYFEDPGARKVFETIAHIAAQYNTRPTKESVVVTLDGSNTPEGLFNQCMKTIDSLTVSDTDTKFLVDETEKWCRDRSLALGISKAIELMDDLDDFDKNKLSKTAIPKILSDALAVSFDTEVGLDYYSNVEAQYEYYHNEDSRIPFPLDALNRLTRGGYKYKSLNIVQAGINVGKTTFLVWLASECLKRGMNVLYFTMEIDDKTVAERLDTSYMGITFDDLYKISKDDYLNRHKTNHARYGGKLLIKEYPADTANANHFRYVINEAKLKKNFVPDIIIVDYLTICASSSLNAKARSNSDQYYTAVASELRSISQEYNAPVWTASQLTRAGQKADDVSITDGGLSLGIAKTADFMFAMMQPEELEADNIVLCKIIKNRYAKRSGVKKFRLILDNDMQQIREADVIPPGAAVGGKNNTAEVDDWIM